MHINIGVDIGGTKIAAGAVTKDGRIVSLWREPTPKDSDSIVSSIVSAINHLSHDNDVRAAGGVQAVGISAAGFISHDRSAVVFSPNLCWRNEPLAQRVSQATGLPVVLENDANAAAWGEYRFGAAAGHTTVAMVTVGTGIGGGLIINGELVRGAHGFGAEFGHMILNPNGELCGCGQRGCWEAQASGTALVRLARQFEAKYKHSEHIHDAEQAHSVARAHSAEQTPANLLLETHGAHHLEMSAQHSTAHNASSAQSAHDSLSLQTASGDTYPLRSRMSELAGEAAIEGKDITRAAEEGDAAALSCFEEIGRWTGIGLASLSAVFDPSIFVISGGVSETGDLLLSPIRRSFREALTAPEHRPLPPIVVATLGNQAGIIGAADLARQ